MTEPDPKANLADILEGKAEILPEDSKTGPQVHPTSVKPKINNPEYLKGETISSGGTMYDGSDQVFLDETDDSIADIDAPPPPATYDVKTAGLLSYLIPVVGPFIVLGSVRRDNKEQRFHALQALIIQLLAFIVISVVIGFSAFLANTGVRLLIPLVLLFRFLGKLLAFIFVIIGIFCAVTATGKPIRLPYLSKFIDSQLK